MERTSSVHAPFMKATRWFQLFRTVNPSRSTCCVCKAHCACGKSQLDPDGRRIGTMMPTKHRVTQNHLWQRFFKHTHVRTHARTHDDGSSGSGGGSNRGGGGRSYSRCCGSNRGGCGSNSVVVAAAVVAVVAAAVVGSSCSGGGISSGCGGDSGISRGGSGRCSSFGRRAAASFVCGRFCSSCVINEAVWVRGSVCSRSCGRFPAGRDPRVVTRRCVVNVRQLRNSPSAANNLHCRLDPRYTKAAHPFPTLLQSSAQPSAFLMPSMDTKLATFLYCDEIGESKL